jgi:ribose/xylose/arabinose/galactoside ABC-type transport system permease subunit
VGEKSTLSLRRLANTARTYFSQYGILVWILVVGIVFSLLSRRFLDLHNLLNIVTQSSIIGILSVGMTLVIITGGGGIDLSVGSIVGISSVTMAMLIIPPSYFRDTASMLSLSADPFTLIKAVAVALLVGTACGAVNGLFISRVGLPPFIATLGMMITARGVAAYVSSGMPTYGMPAPIIFLGQGRIGGIPLPILIMLALGIIGYFVLTRTVFGASIIAIGGNRETAKLSGIRVKRILLIVYALNGLLAAVAGIVLTGYGNQAHPEAGSLSELYAIGAVVVGGTSLMGGKGGIVGSLLGAILMAEVQNGINILNIPVAYMQPALGVLIVLAVMLDQWQKRRAVAE